MIRDLVLLAAVGALAFSGMALGVCCGQILYLLWLEHRQERREFDAEMERARHRGDFLLMLERGKFGLRELRRRRRTGG